jgi:DNA-binding beta-propeller fold protein YncE
MHKISWFGAFVFALAAGLPVSSQAQPLYQITKTIPLPGGPKWDYLHFDAATNRVYIARGTDVAVINAATGARLGTLAGLPGSHGIAVDPATGLVYADSAAKSEVIAFNPQTFKPVASMPVLDDADGMAYDPASHQIFVAGGDANGVTPINPATNKSGPMIALGGSPEFLAADGAGSLYVNINDKDQIVRIDTATDKITARWPTAPCASPTGLAVDPAHRLLFSSCHSGVMLVMNADTGAVVATPPIGKGTDAAAFDPATGQAFSSNSSGTLNIIAATGPGQFSDVSLPTAQGARTLAVDPATGRVFLVTAKILSATPATTPNGHPKYKFAPNSVKLLILDPVK